MTAMAVLTITCTASGELHVGLTVRLATLWYSSNSIQSLRPCSSFSFLLKVDRGDKTTDGRRTTNGRTDDTHRIKMDDDDARMMMTTMDDDDDDDDEMD